MTHTFCALLRFPAGARFFCPTPWSRQILEVSRLVRVRQLINAAGQVIEVAKATRSV